MGEKTKANLDSLLRARSPFIYVNGATYFESKRDEEGSKAFSKHEVIDMYDRQIFSLSDVHIAKIVADNIFATVPMLKKAMAYYHRSTADNQKIAVIKDLKTVKGRLDDHLCRAQLLKKTKFAGYKELLSSPGIEEKVYYSYYTCTPHGYNFVKRLVNFDRPYDEYSGILYIDQVFKYLTTITVCQTFYDIRGFKDYKINNQEYTLNTKTGKKFFKPYGKVEVELPGDKGPGSKEINEYIIEPFFLSYNSNRICERDNIKDIKERFSNLNEYYNARFAAGNGHIIFACEDIQAIKGAIQLAKEYLPYILDNVYFTIDIEADKGGIKSSCLKLSGNKTEHIEIPNLDVIKL